MLEEDWKEMKMNERENKNENDNIPDIRRSRQSYVLGYSRF